MDKFVYAYTYSVLAFRKKNIVCTSLNTFLLAPLYICPCYIKISFFWCMVKMRWRSVFRLIWTIRSHHGQGANPDDRLPASSEEDFSIAPSFLARLVIPFLARFWLVRKMPSACQLSALQVASEITSRATKASELGAEGQAHALLTLQTLLSVLCPKKEKMPLLPAVIVYFGCW